MINDNKHFLKSFIELSFIIAGLTCIGRINSPNEIKPFVAAIKPYICGIFAIDYLYLATRYSSVAFGIEQAAFPPSPIERISQAGADLIGYIFSNEDE